MQGYKIFVSYKYRDKNVAPLQDAYLEYINPTTVRDYVNVLESYFDEYTNNIYKGESDDTDLSDYDEYTIWSLLKDRIFDSSITIVLISPNMRERYRSERSQWIPWEISFSLKETTRNDRTSHSNAILAVVLPDKNYDYSYCFENINCPGTLCRCNHYNDAALFSIIRRNMFNAKYPQKRFCDNNPNLCVGEHSYITFVKWNDFCESPQRYLNHAVFLKGHIDEYNISKEV